MSYIKWILVMGILINPKGRSPSGHSVLEKQHLSNKMIVFQDALINLIRLIKL